MPQHGNGGKAVALDRRFAHLLATQAAMGGDSASFGEEPPTQLVLRKVLATEHDVHSLTFGIKGKVDATMEVELRSSGGKVSRVIPIPFELKTGKRSQYNMNEHNAQVLCRASASSVRILDST